MPIEKTVAAVMGDCCRMGVIVIGFKCEKFENWRNGVKKCYI